MNHTVINNYIKANKGEIEFYVFLMKVKDILPIYYVAVRGRDNEPGAVQRVLNKRRIGSICDFILEGNVFFNTFILNWVEKEFPIKIFAKTLEIPNVSGGAQVIDGQHRLEGLKRAYERKPEIGEQEIIVLLTNGINTSKAARIFLNINAEQKPVPKSLVYDLFGEVRDKNYYIVRAGDIANKLHEDTCSPYYQCIKLPGSSQGIGKIDLSTVVNALKSYTVDGGVFDQYHLDDFESQYKVVLNFFNVLKIHYDKEGNWLKNINPFMSNAGFYAGVEFLCRDLVPKCVEKKSFEEKVITDLLSLDEAGLMYRDDIKNLQGKEQRKYIYDFLKTALLREVPEQDEYKF